MSSIMREFRVGFGKSILGLTIWCLAVLSTEVSLLGQTGPEENQVAVNRGGARLLKLFEPGTLDFSGPGSWPRGSQVATDPEEDWINRFATVSSREQYNENTDDYRDLRALLVACEPEWIFFRIDCTRMDTLTYSDFLIFLDLGTPDKGSKNLRSPVEGGDLQGTWEHGWERVIFLQCWFDFGPESFFAFHIHDNLGKKVGGYNGRGDPAGMVSANEYGIRAYEEKSAGMFSDTGGIAIGFKREMLGLTNKDPLELKLLVCSLKGGIEQMEKALEKPADVTYRGDASVINIADTFGTENTRQRLILSPKGHDGQTSNNVVKGAVSILIPAVK